MSWSDVEVYPPNVDERFIASYIPALLGAVYGYDGDTVASAQVRPRQCTRLTVPTSLCRPERRAILPSLPNPALLPLSPSSLSKAPSRSPLSLRNARLCTWCSDQAPDVFASLFMRWTHACAMKSPPVTSVPTIPFFFGGSLSRACFAGTPSDHHI